MSLDKMDLEAVDILQKQKELAKDIGELKEKFTSLSSDIKDLTELFRDFKTVVQFLKNTGNFLRWIALTGAAVAAILAFIFYMKDT